MIGLLGILACIFQRAGHDVAETNAKAQGRERVNPENGLYFGYGGKQYDYKTNREAYQIVEPTNGHAYVVDAKDKTVLRDLTKTKVEEENERKFRAGATCVPDAESNKTPYGEKIEGRRYRDKNGRCYVIRMKHGVYFYFDVVAGRYWQATDYQKIRDVKSKRIYNLDSIPEYFVGVDEFDMPKRVKPKTWLEYYNYIIEDQNRYLEGERNNPSWYIMACNANKCEPFAEANISEFDYELLKDWDEMNRGVAR